jgi:hypothetical protein
MKNILLLLSLIQIISCTKKETAPVQIEALQITNIKRTSFYARAWISGSDNFIEKGFCIDTVPGATLANSDKVVVVTGESFEELISGLRYGTTYYIRAFSRTSMNTIYSKEEVIQTEKSVFALGDVFRGGVVCYLDSTGEHGLIVAKKDAGRFRWQNCNLPINGTSPDIGKGALNTILIMNFLLIPYNPCYQNAPMTAAEACYKFVYEGETGWYLPSLLEMKAIKNFLSNNTNAIIATEYNLAEDCYWTSTELDQGSAYLVTGKNTVTNTDYSSKSDYWAVRPVRAL